MILPEHGSFDAPTRFSRVVCKHEGTPTRENNREKKRTELLRERKRVVKRERERLRRRSEIEQPKIEEGFFSPRRVAFLVGFGG
ncbi:hypothetical protein SCA6_014334 [Theobroma cacao]